MLCKQGRWKEGEAALAQCLLLLKRRLPNRNPEHSEQGEAALHAGSSAGEGSEELKETAFALEEARAGLRSRAPRVLCMGGGRD